MNKKLLALSLLVTFAMISCATTQKVSTGPVFELQREGVSHYKAGKSALRAKNIDQAIRDFTQAIDTFQEVYQLCLSLGWTKCDVDDGKFDDTLAWVYAYRASAKRLMGNDNGAELDCTTSLKYNYKLPLPHGVLASLYVKKGKQYLARVEYFILLDLDTNMAAAVRKGYIQAFGKEP